MISDGYTLQEAAEAVRRARADMTVNGSNASDKAYINARATYRKLTAELDELANSVLTASDLEDARLRAEHHAREEKQAVARIAQEAARKRVDAAWKAFKALVAYEDGIVARWTTDRRYFVFARGSVTSWCHKDYIGTSSEATVALADTTALSELADEVVKAAQEEIRISLTR